MNKSLPKFLLDKNDKLADCGICGNHIRAAEGYGQSGFNFNIEYFCEECVKQIERLPRMNLKK